MQIKRYIRAYHKTSEDVAYEIELPSDAFDFLSQLVFLQSGSDSVLYYVQDIEDNHINIISKYFGINVQVESDKYDYFYECERTFVKTKEQLLELVKTDAIFQHIKDMVRLGSLHALEELCYRVYKQGVSDESLQSNR